MQTSRRFETLSDFARQLAGRLEAAGIEPGEARLDAELLLRETLGWDRAQWAARARDAAPGDLAARVDPLVERRARREPMAYILGRREFWGRDFAIRPGVLIPRPETEILVEQVLARLPNDSHHVVADVGTGSGCIAVTVALERATARVIATDTSAVAVETARANAARHGVTDRIAFQRLAPQTGGLLGDARAGMDLIVSNPPYVPAGTRDTLQPEVRDYEPPASLFAGDDGLDVIRPLIAAASDHLVPGGWLLFELGWGQAQTVERLLRAGASWREVELVLDLAGLPRVAIARRATR